MSETFRIERLGHQGDGIAEGPVFAPLTLPGERVTGKLDGQTLRDVKIVKPSPGRVTPPCRHFPACGGCQLQHAADPFVQSWKSGVVAQALQAHGLTADFLPMHSSPAQSRRRAVVAVKRTKKGAMVGFHAPASDIVIETPECRLLHPDLMRAFPAAEAMALAGASRKQVLSVMLTLSGQGVDVCVLNGKPLDGPMRMALAKIAAQFDLARLSWGHDPVVTRRAPWQTFGTATVTPPPGAFLQATAEGQAALQSDVRMHVADARHVADLFSGCGTFALDLAGQHQVHAVEADAAMIAALDQGWRAATGLKTVTSEARDLFRRPLMPDELTRFDAVILDPPRAGAEAQVAQIAGARVPSVVYVSCNPVSFARDAARLAAAGYALRALRVVDQFTWSTHVEIVSKFGLNLP